MTQMGIAHHCAKLTPAKVRAIRYLYYVRHIDTRCLSRLYGYNIGTLWDCVHYVTWKQVKDTFTADQIIRVEKE